jgi:SRF-type transcription factor (DNA-binding and dimerisation domain)
MVVNDRKRRTYNLARRKKTLLKKVYELGKYYDVDVALIIRQNGQYITYRSIDLESLNDIASIYRGNVLFIMTIHTKVKISKIHTI